MTPDLASELRRPEIIARIGVILAAPATADCSRPPDPRSSSGQVPDQPPSLPGSAGSCAPLMPQNRHADRGRDRRTRWARMPRARSPASTSGNPRRWHRVRPAAWCDQAPGTAPPPGTGARIGSPPPGLIRRAPPPELTAGATWGIITTTTADCRMTAAIAAASAALVCAAPAQAVPDQPAPPPAPRHRK